MRVTRVVVATAASLCLLSAGFVSAASAKVRITVDLDSQTMHVESDVKTFDWKVSSGKPGYETPNGKYGVLWMDKDHHSDEYDGAYMPNAIFFAPGFAIHGFGKSPWGHKASHGCIRIPTAKSEILYGLVKAQGAEVNIVGETTGTAPTIASTHAPRGEEAAGDNAAPRYGYDNNRDDGFERAAGPQPRQDDQSLFNSVY